MSIIYCQISREISILSEFSQLNGNFQLICLNYLPNLS